MLKKICSLSWIIIVVCSNISYCQSVSGSASGDPSAALDLSSLNRGFLMPRMSSLQRSAIVDPAPGLQVFDTTTSTVWFYNGSAWINNTAPDATAISKGVIQLSGDLTGTAGLPLIADGAVDSGKIKDLSIANNDLAAGTAGIYGGSGSLSENIIISGAAYGLAINSTSPSAFSVDGSAFLVDAENKAVGIGALSYAAKAILELSSDNKGLLVPRLSTQDRNLLSNPSRGLLIFNTTANCVEIYDGASWFNTCTGIDTATLAKAVGTVKYGFQSADHNGWVMLDGRLLSTLTTTQQSAAASIGISSKLPDARGRMPIGAGSSYTSKASAGSFLINKANLDTATRSAVTSYTPKGLVDSAYSGGSVISTRNSTHTHTGWGNPGWDGTNSFGFSDRTDAYYSDVKTSSNTHSHTVTVPDPASTFTGTASAVTVPNIALNSTTQKPFLPPYIALNVFVFLGN